MEQSINQLMRLTGFSYRKIVGRLENLPSLRIDGRAIFYDSTKALPLIYDAAKPNELEEQLAEVQLAVEEERLTKLKLENGRATGELVAVDEVVQVVGNQCSIVRAQMRSLPSRLAKPLSMVTDPNEVFTRLRDAIDECLAELTANTYYEQSGRELEAARAGSRQDDSATNEALPDVKPSRVGGPEKIPKPGIK